MATRRPASSRGRPISTNAMPPPSQIQRPKSVIAKQPSSYNADEATNSTNNTTSSRTLKKGQEGGESHIQVILRCRGRSEREIQANSPDIVQIQGAKNKELTIETSAPASSLGIINLPPTRTYPFDLVFGPEATQSMIYHDVVGPMLKEVMEGYNCTLFAYGQTGTGKTYTMQGDLAPTPMGNPSADAGIIPRVLFRLFHELEKAHTDFVVKISFIELYNEELRDLLSDDLSAPTTLTQPMGKDAKGNEEKLKIFDDVSKRGVVIQGLEEVAVKDSKDALALLTKGSERRQIAATKFNDHSSRSHSVFSITVHIKEVTGMGDDLLKVGKLNLVDLAGSENIGRSGAENKRAREAGMINQSLLTLGRVINALVDKAQHVPYRESKLTRLLQDSLGGRTKTCIIATISPSRSNLEETLSTLDYALRAKSIRNKPELNQRMTRNSLLKEYVVEIERLKADLFAAREKNGIYFSEENWKQINTDNELRETELKEAKKQVEIIENQMRVVRDEYDQSIAMLKRREEELQQTRGQLKKTEGTLSQREMELRQLTDTYEQEVIVRQAHQDTEMKLNEVAASLRKTASDSLQDLSGAFEKLDRKNRVLVSNKRVVSENEKLIRAVADTLAKKLDELGNLLHATRTKLQKEASQFDLSQKQAIATQVQKINTHFQLAQDLFQQIETQESIEDHALDSLRRETDEIRQTFNEQLASWAENLITSCDGLCTASSKSITHQIQSLEASANTLCSLMDTVSQKAKAYIDDQHDALQELQSLAKRATDSELVHLKRQNQILAQMLVDQRKESEKAKGELLQKISSLLGDFMQKRDEVLRQSVDNLQSSNKDVEELLTTTYERQSSLHGDMLEKNACLAKAVEKSHNEGNEERTQTNMIASQSSNAVLMAMNEIRTSVSNSATSHSAWVHQQTKAMAKVTNNSFEEHGRAKRARIEASDAIHADLESYHSAYRTFLGSTSSQIEKHTNTSLAWIKEQTKGTDIFRDETAENIEYITRASSTILTNGVKDDDPTGSTPRKRKWQYQDEWSLTGSRDELLKDWQLQRNGPKADKQPTKDFDVSLPSVDQSEESGRRSLTSKHRRTESSVTEAENAEPSSTIPGDKLVADSIRTENTPAEPLIESRKRNYVASTRSSRRMR